MSRLANRVLTPPAITDPDAWHATYPACSILNGDIDDNDQFDNFDIDPFVTQLVLLGCHP